MPEKDAFLSHEAIALHKPEHKALKRMVQISMLMRACKKNQTPLPAVCRRK